MRKFPLSSKIDETNIKENIECILKISAYYATEIIEQLGIDKYLTRLRTPEEIYHLLNFSNLEKDFDLIFNVLTKTRLLEKEGDFFKKSVTYTQQKRLLKEAINSYPSELFQPFISLFQTLNHKYLAVINGEYGKLNDEELTLVLDEFYGTELILSIKEFQYQQAERRLPIFQEKDQFNVVNIGIGSGYDALHLADYFGEKVTVLSIEPKGTLERCRVLQDLYEIYNVDFIERENIPFASLKNSVDLFIGKTNNKLMHLREELKITKQILVPDGYVLLFLDETFTSAMNWILSIYQNFTPMRKREEYLARLRHHGLSRIKYLGLDGSIVALQKSVT